MFTAFETSMESLKKLARWIPSEIHACGRFFKKIRDFDLECKSGIGGRVVRGGISDSSARKVVGPVLVHDITEQSKFLNTDMHWRIKTIYQSTSYLFLWMQDRKVMYSPSWDSLRLSVRQYALQQRWSQDQVIRCMHVNYVLPSFYYFPIREIFLNQSQIIRKRFKISRPQPQ